MMGERENGRTGERENGRGRVGLFWRWRGFEGFEGLEGRMVYSMLVVVLSVAC